MITAVVMGTFGLLTSLIGMQCCKAAEDNPNLKGKLAGTGGVFFLLQGMVKYTTIRTTYMLFN